FVERECQRISAHRAREIEAPESAMNDQDHMLDGPLDYTSARLDSDLLCLPLDDDFVIFSERTQSLLSLNASAAMVVEKLRNGTPSANLVDELVALELAPRDEAVKWVSSTLQALSAHGMLLDHPVAPKAATSASVADEAS